MGRRGSERDFFFFWCVDYGPLFQAFGPITKATKLLSVEGGEAQANKFRKSIKKKKIEGHSGHLMYSTRCCLA